MLKKIKLNKVNKFDLQERTKKFSIRIIKLSKSLPKSIDGRTIANQIIRCGTSVGANYRAACCGKSKADFIAKLGIVEEELDECMFWLELIIELNLVKKDLLADLYRETNELLAIIISSKKSARKNQKPEK
jgi:four helix bundle protein